MLLFLDGRQLGRLPETALEEIRVAQPKVRSERNTRRLGSRFAGFRSNQFHIQVCKIKSCELIGSVIVIKVDRVNPVAFTMKDPEGFLCDGVD